MRYPNRIWAFVLLVALASALAGCGGGGGGSAPRQDVVFEPNYVNSLDGLNHWAFLPIKVFFAVPTDWSYSASLPGEAATSWNQSGRQDFFMVAASSGGSDVVCSFVDAPPPTWGGNTIAITQYSVDTSQHLMVPGTVSVTCALHDKDGRPMSPEQMRTSISHELGHVLGISGHSPNTDDLLYPLQQPGISSPQTRDFNTAMTAYPNFFTGARTQFHRLEVPNPAFVVERQIP